MSEPQMSFLGSDDDSQTIHESARFGLKLILRALENKEENPDDLIAICVLVGMAHGCVGQLIASTYEVDLSALGQMLNQIKNGESDGDA
jgi:hypothetical protein